MTKEEALEMFAYSVFKTDTIRNKVGICLHNGASQGQNLALTVLFVPNSLDSGLKLIGLP